MTRRGFFARCAAIAGAMLLPATKVAGITIPAGTLVRCRWSMEEQCFVMPEWYEGVYVIIDEYNSWDAAWRGQS